MYMVRVWLSVCLMQMISLNGIYWHKQVARRRRTKKDSFTVERTEQTYLHMYLWHYTPRQHCWHAKNFPDFCSFYHANTFLCSSCSSSTPALAALCPLATDVTVRVYVHYDALRTYLYVCMYMHVIPTVNVITMLKWPWFQQGIEIPLLEIKVSWEYCWSTGKWRNQKNVVL